MQNLQEATQNYNELLKRWHKYQNFVENPKISLEEKEKWVPQAQTLTHELSRKLIEISKLGYKYSDEEARNGFERLHDEYWQIQTKARDDGC